MPEAEDTVLIWRENAIMAFSKDFDNCCYSGAPTRICCCCQVQKSLKIYVLCWPAGYCGVTEKKRECSDCWKDVPLD